MISITNETNERLTKREREMRIEVKSQRLNRRELRYEGLREWWELRRPKKYVKSEEEA